MSIALRDYAADEPITCTNPLAVIQAVACVDKHERAFQCAVAGRLP